jgi:hypothetical protein
LWRSRFSLLGTLGLVLFQHFHNPDALFDVKGVEAIASLSQMPKRCPLARENEHFSQELHQLLYGR